MYVRAENKTLDSAFIIPQMMPSGRYRVHIYFAISDHRIEKLRFCRFCLKITCKKIQFVFLGWLNIVNLVCVIFAFDLKDNPNGKQPITLLL